MRAGGGKADSLPPWVCQPYVRLPVDEHLKKMEQCIIRQREKEKRALDDDEISKRKLKKLQRYPNKAFKSRRNCDICCQCPNPKGLRCPYLLCRTCCKTKCYVENLDCVGHRILVKTKRTRAAQFAKKEEKLKNEGGTEKTTQEAVEREKVAEFGEKMNENENCITGDNTEKNAKGVEVGRDVGRGEKEITGEEER